MLFSFRFLLNSYLRNSLWKNIFILKYLPLLKLQRNPNEPFLALVNIFFAVFARLVVFPVNRIGFIICQRYPVTQFLLWNPKSLFEQFLAKFLHEIRFSEIRTHLQNEIVNSLQQITFLSNCQKISSRAIAFCSKDKYRIPLYLHWIISFHCALHFLACGTLSLFEFGRASKNWGGGRYTVISFYLEVEQNRVELYSRKFPEEFLFTKGKTKMKLLAEFIF